MGFLCKQNVRTCGFPEQIYNLFEAAGPGGESIPLGSTKSLYQSSTLIWDMVTFKSFHLSCSPHGKQGLKTLISPQQSSGTKLLWFKRLQRTITEKHIRQGMFTHTHALVGTQANARANWWQIPQGKVFILGLKETGYPAGRVGVV